MHRYISRSFVLSLCFLCIAALGIFGVNLAVSQPEGITGCVHKKTGILRIARVCNSSERLISWSVFGPSGPQGPKGDNGERGVQGVPGNSILSGIGAPTVFIGETGDFYIDLSVYKIYGPKKSKIGDNQEI